MTGGPCEYLANLHVHTSYSDGTGSIEEVIAAAQKAGLDLLLINDHDTLAAKDQGYEGYHGRVLVLVGVEISGRHNHYLAYGVDKCPERDWQAPQEFIDQVKADGGIGFLAHPFEKGSPLSEGGRAFTWVDWTVTGFDGLCVWNYTSSWKARARHLSSALLHYVLRSRTLLGPDEETLAKWDELGQTRRVAGVGGSDAHAAKVLGPLKVRIFPYKYLFRAVNTHLLLPRPLGGNLKTDRAAVLKALAGGSCFIAHDLLHSGRGFDFRLKNQDQTRVLQGQETRFQDGDILVWRLPDRAPARLVKDGRVILVMTADQGRFEVGSPGVYRLEVFWLLRFFGPRPWIFSNPIYLRE